MLIYLSIASSEQLLKYIQGKPIPKIYLQIYTIYIDISESISEYESESISEYEYIYKDTKTKTQQINVFPISTECSFFFPLPPLSVSSSALSRLLSYFLLLVFHLRHKENHQSEQIAGVNLSYQISNQPSAGCFLISQFSASGKS